LWESQIFDISSPSQYIDPTFSSINSLILVKYFSQLALVSQLAVINEFVFLIICSFQIEEQTMGSYNPYFSKSIIWLSFMPLHHLFTKYWSNNLSTQHACNILKQWEHKIPTFVNFLQVHSIYPLSLLKETCLNSSGSSSSLSFPILTPCASNLLSHENLYTFDTYI